MTLSTTPFPKVPFLGVVSTLLGIPPQYCVWGGEREPVIGKPVASYNWALARVDISRRTAVGWDDMRQTDNDDGSFTLLQIGRRVLTISIDLFVFSGPELLSADDMLEDLNSSIFDDDNRDQLNQMGLALENTGDILSLPTYINARYISAAHTDMTIAFGVTRTAQVAGGNGTTIREIIGTGTVTSEDGTTTSLPFDIVGD